MLLISYSVSLSVFFLKDDVTVLKNVNSQYLIYSFKKSLSGIPGFLNNEMMHML